MYIEPLSIGINTEKCAQDELLKDIPYPVKYEDLLIPELQGKVDIPNPETSGTGYTLLASLEQERGSDEAISLLYKLKQQSASTNFSGITSAQRLSILRAITNRPAAKQLVEFVLSSDAQNYYMNTAFSIHVEPTIEVNQALTSVVKESLLQNYRFDLAADRRDALLTKWKTVVNNV